MMNVRERFSAAINFQPFDRLPILEWAGWWDKTLQRWYGEGLPLYITDRYEICEYLELDLYMQHWFLSTGPQCPSPESHGAGIIRSESDYDEIKPFLYPGPDESIDKETWAEMAARQESGEAVVWFTIDGFFWFARRLLGIERHLFSFYDQPELLHRINTDLAEWSIDLIDNLLSVCTPDFMTFAEDMSYNHGPMLSEDLFEVFMKPYYDMVIPHLRKAGIAAFVDSDGDVSDALAWFEDASVEGVLPLERQSGIDIEDLRKAHPNMKFIGHFDKMVMNRGEEAMRAEFERLLPVAARGGYLPSCDHQTPPGVSFNDYRSYLKLFREYAERAGKMSRQLRDGT